jgi:hypothetical protein
VWLFRGISAVLRLLPLSVEVLVEEVVSDLCAGVDASFFGFVFYFRQ